MIKECNQMIKQKPMYMEQNLLIEKEDTKCSNVIKLYKG